MSRLRSGNVPRRWTSMKRGIGHERQRGRDRRIEAFGMAGRQHRAARSPPSISASASASGRRDRLLDQHRDAALEKRQRNLEMRRRSVPRRSRHRRSPADRRRGQRRRAVLRRNSLGAPGLMSTTPTSSTPCIEREQAGMMLAEMADTDDSDATRIIRHAARSRRRSRCRPRWRTRDGSPSKISVLPASIDNTAAPARAWPESSRGRRPARRSACPGSASPP